ncbi:hypothetical protein PPERSA_07866 [Pseudocohnilembus persalinus]|uniref:Uncharacterized protein n=1 Tax=Pseudocohnilembus persalinus TaxID=266149 RepID=A0A0V0QC17_PSEPJ|nr:hypothetical protein PPERSA_07866 [Pseudocohnilembus persalinus]|eukprot:KRW99789.1 hypothetical protein PPERSA_07866 [Pseudocohnilembus persalinus]
MEEKELVNLLVYTDRFYPFLQQDQHREILEKIEFVMVEKNFKNFTLEQISEILYIYGVHNEGSQLFYLMLLKQFKKIVHQLDFQRLQRENKILKINDQEQNQSQNENLQEQNLIEKIKNMNKQVKINEENQHIQQEIDFQQNTFIQIIKCYWGFKNSKFLGDGDEILDKKLFEILEQKILSKNQIDDYNNKKEKCKDEIIYNQVKNQNYFPNFPDFYKNLFLQALFMDNSSFLQKLFGKGGFF